MLEVECVLSVSNIKLNTASRRTEIYGKRVGLQRKNVISRTGAGCSCRYTDNRVVRNYYSLLITHSFQFSSTTLNWTSVNFLNDFTMTFNFELFWNAVFRYLTKCQDYVKYFSGNQNSREASNVICKKLYRS